MNKCLLSGIALLSCLATTQAATFQPSAPSDLKGDVNGLIVNLSWEWEESAVAGAVTDFEGEEFPPEKWEIQYGSEDVMGNWMQYDFEDPDFNLAHSGSKTAILMMAEGDDENPSSYHQDEWMMTTPEIGSVYMDFWYYIHPELLEVGSFKDFPDHYYVLISRDNGMNWTELWDARWDMGNIDGTQRASIFLGEPTDENTIVAFRALSAEEESLYFLWVVDDITFFSHDDAGKAKLVASASKNHKDLKKGISFNTHRTFVPSATSARMARRVPESEWLNSGNTTFRVYLDDEMIGDYIKTRGFTDFSSKEPGIHTYRVMAWNEAEDKEYPESELSIEINEFKFPAIQNAVASYEAQDNGKYIVQVRWEAPDGDMIPDHYNIYVNGKSIGWINADEELAIGQSGLYKGAYTFEVEAVYTYPEGVSDRIAASVYPGTVPTPVNFAAVEEENSYILTWEAPITDPQPTGYTLYRGDKLLVEGFNETKIIDTDVPEGVYEYNLHAVYPDGNVSLPVSVSIVKGDDVIKELPFEESLTNKHLPADWKIKLIDPYENVKDMYAWRFDNWFEQSLSPDMAESGCASVSAKAAGMNLLQTFLISPRIYIPEKDENMAVSLEFNKYFLEEKPGPSGPAQFMIEISTDNGENWENLADLTALDNGICTFPLDKYADEYINLRWGFLGRSSGEAAINNLTITAKDISGISEITDNDNLVDIFSADGRIILKDADKNAVSNLPAGLYIIRSGETSTKILK